jgi:hypothetical protein
LIELIVDAVMVELTSSDLVSSMVEPVRVETPMVEPFRLENCPELIPILDTVRVDVVIVEPDSVE